PRPALFRPDRVDHAAFLPVIEDAIAVGLLAQRHPTRPLQGIDGPHFLDAFTAKLRDGHEFFLVHPHPARLARTALPAHRAGETQALRVPRFVAHPSSFCCFCCCFFCLARAFSASSHSLICLTESASSFRCTASSSSVHFGSIFL